MYCEFGWSKELSNRNNFMFIGPFIAILCHKMSKKMQPYTVYLYL